MKKKIAFTDYKKLFTRLYSELENAKNEIEVILNERPFKENLCDYDYKFTNENGETKYINSPYDLPTEITTKMIQTNCDREYVMWCMELIISRQRKENLSKMIFHIAMSNDEAFEAKNEIMHKYKKEL